MENAFQSMHSITALSSKGEGKKDRVTLVTVPPLNLQRLAITEE